MSRNKWGIWHYVKSYKFNSIFIKTFLLIVLPTIIPLVLISASIYNYYSSNIREEIKTANINGLSKIKNMVDKTALECDKLSAWLATDSDIKLLLSYPQLNAKDFYTFEKFQNLNRVLSGISTTNDIIGSVYIYFAMSEFVLATDGYSMDFMSFQDREWKSEYLNLKKTASYWVSPRIVTRTFLHESNQYYLSSFRTISNYGQEGLVVVNIDIQKLKNIIDTVDDKKAHELLIADRDGRILYSSDMRLLGKNVEELERFQSLPLTASGSIFVKDASSVDQIVTVQSSDYNHWKYVYITPVSQYSQRADEFVKFMLFSVFSCLVIAIAIAFFISIKVFQPIKNMVSLLDKPAEWEGLIQIDDERNFNEFKYVARTILKSMDRTRQMEEAMAERMELLRKAQSIALQAQINPHFLNNTLETINWKAMSLTGGENDVSQMLAALSQLLRLSLETGNSMVTIGTEMEHAQLYLGIQNMRYREKFQVLWNMEPDILERKIIKLTLQPLLENAIYHGIKPKKDNGTITITGTVRENQIAMEIADNGVGMAKEEVESLNRDMKDGYIREDLHIGMRNVNQRIKLVFGEEYGITVESEYRKYTLVRILIPIVE